MSKTLSIAGENIIIQNELYKQIFKEFETDVPVENPILSLEINENLNPKNPVLLHESEQTEDSITVKTKFYKTLNGWFYSTQENDIPPLLMEVYPDGKNKKFSAFVNRKSGWSELRRAMWTAANIAFSTKRIVSVHASVIIHGSKAAVFLGKSGAGKSTHSQLYIDNICGCELLNDDTPFLQFDENKNLKIWGSPWSGKTHCYKNKNSAVAAFVQLEQALHNKIRKLGKLDAIGCLFSSLPTFMNYDEDLKERKIQIISEILKQYSVYYLENLPNPDAARISYKTVFLTD